MKLTKTLNFRMSVPEIPGYDSGVTEAIDKVEQKIGRPLTKDDGKGLSLLQGELDALNSK